MQAQKEAAAIFGAEKTYFVLNGTSSSNKIVLTNLIAEGDLVLFDRNNHKAAHQGALLMGGGIPVYLSTDRNAYGYRSDSPRSSTRRRSASAFVTTR